MFFVIPEMPSKTFVMLYKKNFLITLTTLHHGISEVMVLLYTEHIRTGKNAKKITSEKEKLF